MVEFGDDYAFSQKKKKSHSHEKTDSREVKFS